MKILMVLVCGLLASSAQASILGTWKGSATLKYDKFLADTNCDYVIKFEDKAGSVLFNYDATCQNGQGAQFKDVVLVVGADGSVSVDQKVVGSLSSSELKMVLEANGNSFDLHYMLMTEKEMHFEAKVHNPQYDISAVTSVHLVKE